MSVICDSRTILPDNTFTLSSSVSVLKAPNCIYLEMKTEAIRAMKEKSILLIYAVKETIYFDT